MNSSASYFSLVSFVLHFGLLDATRGLGALPADTQPAWLGWLHAEIHQGSNWGLVHTSLHLNPESTPLRQ